MIVTRTHLRRVLGAARRSAFWLCCALTVGCLVLIIPTRTVAPYFVRTSTDGTWYVRADGGMLGLGWVDWEYQLSTGGATHWGTETRSHSWDRLLNPLTAARTAGRVWRYSPLEWRLAVPLLWLANLFALWPLCRLWRHWRQQRLAPC